MTPRFRALVKRILERPVVRRLAGAVAPRIPFVGRIVDDGLTIFAYHEISDSPSPFVEQFNLAVSPRVLREQLHFIKESFSVIGPEQILSGHALPERAALISFDDGFLGAFEHGLPALLEFELPSVHFLNMRCVLERRPLESATSCFLGQYDNAFMGYARSVGLRPPFHHTLSPRLLAAFESRHPIDTGEVLKYQGELVDVTTLRHWDGNPLVHFANHLYEHWNAAALDVAEFADLYTRNEQALASLTSRVGLFAFPNGQPYSCFSRQHLDALRDLGAGRVFCSSGGLNPTPGRFCLDRLCLTAADTDPRDVWFRLGRGALESRRSWRGELT